MTWGCGVLLCLVVAAPCTAGSGEKHIIDFDHVPAGALPSDWESAMTKTGGDPAWAVRHDDTAPSKPNVLAQTSADRTAGRFPLAVYRGARFLNGEVSVRFKPISGTIDQAAGLVWRYVDRNNYYIVRANALENNVVAYKVLNGERTSLAPRGMPSRSYGVRHPVPKLVWSELKVDFNGSLAVVYLNQEKLFDLDDTTFAGAGRVGLWTKADSVMYFDDFTFSAR